jgi:hypothetical protein
MEFQSATERINLVRTNQNLNTRGFHGLGGSVSNHSGYACQQQLQIAEWLLRGIHVCTNAGPRVRATLWIVNDMSIVLGGAGIEGCGPLHLERPTLSFPSV